MYAGRIVEIARTRDLFRHPAHPYTEALISAIPRPEAGRRERRIILKGNPPSLAARPSGCAFRTRCRYAAPQCAAEVPLFRLAAPGHLKACLRDDLELDGIV